MRNFSAIIAGAIAASTIMAAGMCYAEEGGVTLTPSGFAALREGQVVKGEHETMKSATSFADADFVWIQGMDIGLNVKAEYNGLPVIANLGLEMLVCNDNSPYDGDLGQSRRLNFYPYLSRADFTYSWGDKSNPSLFLNAGYFPYKYNGDVRNLGEYLFRSGTYPQYIITDFDFPMTRLMGARLGGKIANSLNFDLLLTSNVEWTAIGDLNLSGLLSWKPIPLFELGMGASWNSFLSILGINLDNTSPMVEGNSYLAPVPGNPDSLAVYYYTFAGQKIMARFSLDFKSLFSGSDFFGEHDLKLYSEAAVLGLIDYPISQDGYTQYDTLMQRIPVMAGLTIPTFKFMDILSCEVEWFGNPYPGSLNPIKFDNQPIALSSYGNEKSPYYLNNHQDDWKWSVYGKKTFANNFNITVQAARDHFRWFRLDYTAADGKTALRKNDQWYYTFKFGYTF